MQHDCTMLANGHITLFANGHNTGQNPFSRVIEPDRAFGINIAGAMFGGLAEYSSMILGFQYLLFVAVSLYLLSMFGYQKAVTGTPAAHIGHDAAG